MLSHIQGAVVATLEIIGHTYDDDINVKDHELAAEALRHALQAMLGSCIRANERWSHPAGH